MKAFLVEKIGENEFLSRVQDISTPKCAENEIVIKVTYSSLNYKDWKYWKKHYKNKIKTEEDARVAIDTMIASLDDDYSRYLPKKDFAEQNCSIESIFSCILSHSSTFRARTKSFFNSDNNASKFSFCIITSLII